MKFAKALACYSYFPVLIKALHAALALCCGTCMVYGQDNLYKPIHTPENVTVNRTLPDGILAYGEPMKAFFSQNPTDDEIFRVHFFEEPLVPTNLSPLPGESASLIVALAAFSQRTSPDDFTCLQKFLDTYPQSRWRGSLLADLGIVYRRTGYYSKAMAAWQEAWRLLKDEQEPKVKFLADRVIAELLSISSWTGKMDKIDSAVKAISGREFGGPGEDRMKAVIKGLWMMKNRPGISFKCGPFALNELFNLSDSLHRYNRQLTDAQSTPKGFSLAGLQALAQQAGMHYQMAFRQPGAIVIPGAVVHWKLDHYSALIELQDRQYKCEDATQGSVYGREFWITPAALDSSASGYFLVPEGGLPAGWRNVDQTEGASVFGKGNDPSADDNGTGKCDPAVPTCTDCNARSPMAKSNVHSAALSLHVFDRPVFYNPPVGPAMLFDVDYHQRDSHQPANFTYSNFGVKWTFEWLSYVQDNPGSLTANVDVYLMAGGSRTFTTYNSTTKAFARDLSSNDVLVRPCANCYELRHSDGSKEVYERPDGNSGNGRKIFLTRVVDAAGNELKISYDNNLRIVAIQDAINQVTILSYELSSDIYKVTKVTDPFGRFAKFSYDGQGRLASITDVIGIVSSFHYLGADFIDQMTTPYGTTSFTETNDAGGYARSVETHFPMGEKERAEFSESPAVISTVEPVHPAGMLYNDGLNNYRNTFFWDKKAMQDAPGVYAKARIYHWLHGSAATGESATLTAILESVKMPSENRVWYNYQNQPDPIYAYPNMSSNPTVIGRVMDDGTTQLTKFTYNTLGKVASSVDPLNRKMAYSYDTTNINLLEIKQTTGTANELLMKFTYNGQYLPLTSQDASGMITHFAYNGAGQITMVTNPRNEVSKLNYDASGYLQNITGPTNAVTKFTYDKYGRVQTVTDPEGYTVRTDYDSINRPVLITYPDSSFEQIVYDRLDAAHFRDRLGRWSHTTYDSLQRPTIITDPLARITKLGWCSCGSLTQITDPLNRVTIFTHDLMGRDSTKVYPDGKITAYTYEKTTSRLSGVTDAKGQKTQYSYFVDNNLKQVKYANAAVATGSVSFTCDPNYNRVLSMTDTTGQTLYAYNPVQSAPVLGAGRLLSVDGPLANDLIKYSYDSLGRVNGRNINGIASSTVFDALGRMVSINNVLGQFGYSYFNQTNRFSSIKMPNGQSISFDYFDNLGDQRLKQIVNNALNGDIVSKFDYEYNPEGQIVKWTTQAGSTIPASYDIGYDAADQLSTVLQKSLRPVPVTINKYAYKYDSSGNRVTEHINNSVVASEYNNLNQSRRQWNADSLRDNGNQPVLFNNQVSFDFNGNMTAATASGVQYGWDAADRLVKITKGSAISEFVYDGLSRRVAEKLNGVIIRCWLWDGTELAEERDATGGTVLKRFFAQGEQINGASYYFTRDHLGSIREMIDTNGVVKARYDYDPYGRRTKIFGTMDADFGFTGHYYHAASGLHLALYRAYDPNFGRWLNRDPSGENAGLNVYLYCTNEPIKYLDKLGLQSTCEKMKDCPSHLSKNDAVPSGFKPYFGNPKVFHCGFRTILEDKIPSPDSPENECVYDDNGDLVTENSSYPNCSGTPDSYDGKTSPFSHFFRDPGGIVWAGWPAFWESRRYFRHKKN